MAVHYSTEEKDQLVTMFESLDSKPKMDDPESLQKWMEDYLKSKGRSRMTDPEEQKDKLPTAGTPSIIHKTNVFQPPRIVTFSGSGDSKDVSFETWKFEVETLLREGTHSKKEIASLAKKSLRGQASDVVRRLGVDADIHLVLNKLNCVYGVVEEAENLLGQFYNAKQRQDETVASWGCRIEDLLDRANKQEPLHSKSLNDMLRTKFWNGLQGRLKEAARHKTEYVTDYGRLLVEVRKIESEPNGTDTSEGKKDVKKGHVRVMNTSPVQPKDEESEMDLLKGMIFKMNTKLDNMEKIFKSADKPTDVPHSTDQASSQCTYQPADAESTYHHVNAARSRGQYPRSRSRGRGGFRGYGGNWHSQYNSYSHNQPPQQQFPRPEITCYRCGQIGHLSIGCRVDIEQPLNQQESV